MLVFLGKISPTVKFIAKNNVVYWTLKSASAVCESREDFSDFKVSCSLSAGMQISIPVPSLRCAKIAPETLKFSHEPGADFTCIGPLGGFEYVTSPPGKTSDGRFRTLTLRFNSWAKGDHPALNSRRKISQTWLQGGLPIFLLIKKMIFSIRKTI